MSLRRKIFFIGFFLLVLTKGIFADSLILPDKQVLKGTIVSMDETWIRFALLNGKILRLKKEFVIGGEVGDTGVSPNIKYTPIEDISYAKEIETPEESKNEK